MPFCLCRVVCSLVEYVKDAVRLVASREMHVCTTFARRFYWSDLNLWPEDLAPGSVVLLSGKVCVYAGLTEALQFWKTCCCYHMGCIPCDNDLIPASGHAVCFGWCKTLAAPNS